MRPQTVRRGIAALGALLALGCLPGPLLAQTAVGPQQSSPIVVTANGQRLLNVNPEANSVSVYDVTGAPNKVLEAPVGRDPSSLAVVPDGSKAYVANALDGTVTV